MFVFADARSALNLLTRNGFIEKHISQQNANAENASKEMIAVQSTVMYW
jgi:hypothetical protein